MKKVAVVGAGKWGQNLIKTFANLGELAAIVESDVSRGSALAKEYQVDYYQDLDAALAEDLSAFAVATPVITHFEIAKKILLAKKDVFVEKPMTTNADEADELVNLAEENNCILMVGHLLLYQPAIKFIKEFLTAGKLGKVYSMQQIRRSLGTIRKQENVLYSLGVHDLAVLNYLIDEPIDAVLASSQAIISEGVADNMTVHLHYQSGIHAHLHLSWLWPYKDRQLMILGEKGALHFDEISQEVIFYQHYGMKDASVIQEGQEVIFSDNTPPLTLELQHFLDCVDSRSVPRSPGSQGKEVVQLMADIMQTQEKINENKLFYPSDSDRR